MTIGQENLEIEMIHLLVLLGYKGPFCILGQANNEDVALTLKQLLRGLQSLFSDHNSKKPFLPYK